MSNGNLYSPPAASTAYRKAFVLSLLGLAAFLAVEALLLRSFNREDTRPPSWDQALHMQIALDYKQALSQGRVGDAWHLAPKPGMPPFPPAYHLLLTRSLGAADPAHAALWVNWFYLALLSVSIFGIAWRFRPDETAVAAAVMFAASTGIQELYTTQLIDLPMVAVAAAAYWALLASEDFTVWAGGLAFGVLHAVGMLHKWSFFSYMLPAYFVCVRASRTKTGTIVMLASMALSAALLLPWYSAHLAMLPSRLVSASTDFAVSASKPEAWLVYMKLMERALGPVLAIMGGISLLTPQFPRKREQGWVLLAWFAAAYVFWTIVPNRQARFLLPALVPLSIAFCSTWPKAVTWSVVAFQLLAMFNFYGAWISPLELPLPYFSLDFFASRPAAREDWKLEEILRKVEAERDPSRPVTNVTLVANDEYFNAPTFHWTQLRLGLPHARMRGVNSRLCELSEFVLLKDPKLGPGSVIGGLTEASVEVNDRDGWFRSAYEEIARWPLPDRSNAILFRQKRTMPKPYASKSLVYQLFNIGHADLIDLKIAFGPWDAASSSYKTIGLTARQVEVRGLTLRAPDLEMFDASFVPVVKKGREEEWLDLRLMKLGRLKVNKLDIGAAELIAFLNERVKGLSVTSLDLDDTIRVTGTFKGKSVAAEASLKLLDSPRRLKVDILKAQFAGVKVPPSFFREIKELEVSLEPNPETPFIIDLPGLTVKNGRLTIP